MSSLASLTKRETEKPDHEARVAAYIAALKPGVRAQDVAAKLGVTLSTVHNSAYRIGKLLPHPKSTAALRYEEIAAYYAANPDLTQQAVAERFGVLPMTVCCALRATGTPSRRTWKRGVGA